MGQNETQYKKRAMGLMRANGMSGALYIICSSNLTD